MAALQTCGTCNRPYVGASCPNCRGTAAKEKQAALGSGHTIHGYEIVEPLGQGGMGIVYKARQPALNRFVALKILPQERSQQFEFGSRFEREAQALATLSHPNIVTIYDFGKEDDLYFFSMEIVEGNSLRKKIEGGRLPVEEVIRLALQICDALQYAHKQGVVHRDIKPDNILLDKEGRVKVADFGLAKFAQVGDAELMLTETNAVMGTAAYMAPEQMERTRDVDHRADIYSIGVMLYEMLTGRRPLGRFDPPSKISQCAAGLDAIVLKSLAREAEERYQTVAEMRADLEKFAAGVAPAALPTPAKKGLGPWMLVVPLFLLIGAAFAIWRLTRPKPPATTTLTAPPAEKPLRWKDLRTLEGHPEPPTWVEFAPDGNLLISASGDKTINFWDPERGTLRGSARPGGMKLRSAALSPDGKTLATGAQEGGIRIWDVAGRKEVRTLVPEASKIDALAFSPDGRTLAAAIRYAAITLFDLADGKVLQELDRDEAGVKNWLSLAFSPDGRLLASSRTERYQYAVGLWDPAAGREVRMLSGPTTPVFSVAFSPDGNTLVSAEQDGALRFWNVADGKSLRVLTGNNKGINCIAFRSDGKILATAGADKMIRFWDVATGKELQAIEGHSPGVLWVSFRKDGKVLASAGGDGRVRLWCEEE